MFSNIVAAAETSSTSSRYLNPTQEAHEALLYEQQQSKWHRELQSASKIVSSNRYRRSKKKNRQLTTTKCLSPLQKWFISLIESIGIETWEEINTYNITSLSYLYKHHVSSADGTSEYFGVYGDRTSEMKSNHNSITSFWSSSEDSHVFLLGMHGMDLKDDTKLVPTLQQIYNLDGSEAFTLAKKIQSIIDSIPERYNNPILTANAMAIQSRNPNGSKREKDSILIGDGVFNFLEWLNLHSDGPSYIHAHEFGHHLQYDLGVMDKVNTNNGWTKSQETRRHEIMADVFGSYYNAHSSGARMSSNRLLQVHRAAYSMGDCEQTINSHHGTPRQRECASNFGANLALTSYMDSAYKIPAREIRRMFDIRYESILALDSDQCEAVLDTNMLDEEIYGDLVTDNSNSATNTYYEPPMQDLEIPTIEYEPFSDYYFGDYSSQDDWASFEAYDPNEVPSRNDGLDEPPPRVENEDFDILEDGWFGTTQSQWTPRSAADSCYCYLDVRWAFGVVVVLVKLLV